MKLNGSVQQAPRDDLRLNFSGTFEDVQNSGVAEDPADLIFQRKSVAAMNLQRVVGAGPGHARAAADPPFPARQGRGKQRVLDLFAVPDWMLRLPPPQEHQVWQDIEAIERSAGPDRATVRLQAADVSQLEQWADRVLDAPSLEAVFIGH
jgi:hypothetical protein